MIVLRSVDFFCGCGGASYGLSQAGIKPLAGIDNDAAAGATFLRNAEPGAKFFCRDMSKYTPAELTADLPELRPNDNSIVFVGCAPCQHWSAVNKKTATNKKTRSLMLDFLRFVRHYRPALVFVENVRGAKKYEEQSGLRALLNFLESAGYHYDEDIVCCADYGVPQSRTRYIMLASRLGPIALPLPTHRHPTLDQILKQMAADAGIPLKKLVKINLHFGKRPPRRRKAA